MLEQKIDDLISAIERLTTTLAQHSRVEELRTGNNKTASVEPEQVKQPEKTKAKAKAKTKPEPKTTPDPEPKTTPEPESDAQPIPTIDELQKLALSIVRMDTGAKPRVMAAINSHGAERLRDVPEANRHPLHGDLLKLAVDVSAEQEEAA